MVHVSWQSSEGGSNYLILVIYIYSHVETVERNRKQAAESLMAPSSNIELTGVKTQR